MLKVSLLAALLLLASADYCPNPTLVISNTLLDSFFDKLFGSTSFQTELRSLITEPSLQTAQSYITTQSAYLITLWALASLSFLLLVACFLQICCFNCCKVNKCGNKMDYNTYRPSSVTCSVYFFMFFSLLIIAISVGSFIVTSDLLTNLRDSTCEAETTFNYLFDGTPKGFSPAWSGADNFNSLAQNLSINFPNVIPTLNTIFQGSQYDSVVSNATNSLYVLATTYNCPTANATQTVACPFPNNSSCFNGSATQIPTFSLEYCATNSTLFPNSSAVLIAGEQQVNSTTWKNSLISLQSNINNANGNPNSFDSLVSKTSTISTSLQSMKSSLSSGITTVNHNFDQARLGSYIFYSIIIGLGILSFLTSCCVFCTRNFGCRYILYPLWILFAFLAIIFFLASSVLLFASFTTFGLCTSYNYYTTQLAGLQSLPSYNSSNILQVLSTCFITSPKSDIFSTFTSSNLTVVQQIMNNYKSALPSPTFTTVATNITNTLKGYAVNPNNVVFAGAGVGQNPQAALNSINSLSQSSSCNTSNSVFQFNPLQCNPYKINQAPPNPSCIIISSNPNASLPSSVAATCAAASYTQLQIYAGNIQELSSSYLNDPGIQAYASNYLNYYEAVSGLLNGYTQSLFESFILPYEGLLAGSSCSFITTSLDSLINTSCNRQFPQIYAITCLLIAISLCFFFMMILSYYLTTRFQFYQFLNGDLTNYDQNPGSQEQRANELMMQEASQSGRTYRTEKNSGMSPLSVKMSPYRPVEIELVQQSPKSSRKNLLRY